MKAERRFKIGAFFDRYVLRDGAGVPVPFELSIFVHETAPTICAGLPRMRARGGTSRVTSEPASIHAPRPMVTPFKIVALGPIQTSSSILTVLRKTAGRGLPSPKGEQAM